MGQIAKLSREPSFQSHEIQFFTVSRRVVSRNAQKGEFPSLYQIHCLLPSNWAKVPFFLILSDYFLLFFNAILAEKRLFGNVCVCFVPKQNSFKKCEANINPNNASSSKLTHRTSQHFLPTKSAAKKRQKHAGRAETWWEDILTSFVAFFEKCPRSGFALVSLLKDFCLFDACYSSGTALRYATAPFYTTKNLEREMPGSNLEKFG